MDYVDDEILNEIFQRLPVKSLVQLKCIKKRYNTLISSPLSIQQHLTNSLQNHQNLLLTTTPLQSIDLQKWPALTLHGGAATTLGYLTRTPNRPTKILGSCHGLVCMIFDHENWTLLNPATREYTEFPKPKNRSRSTVSNFFYGFGYDSLTDDYKLLRGTCSSEKGFTPASLDIFPFKRGAWSEIGEIKQYRIFGGNRVGTYYKGSVYWLIEKKKENGGGWCFNYRDMHDYEGMLSYNVATGKFGDQVIKLPELEDYGDCFEIQGLTALPGRLLLYGGSGFNQITGWILNEENVETEAWTKMYDYSWKNEPGKGFRVKSKIVQIAEDGNITANLCFRQFSQMQYYDPAKDESKKEDVNEDPHFIDSCVYEETLVSPYTVFPQRRGGRAGLRPRSKKMLRATV